MKNYVIRFIKSEALLVTAQEAAYVAQQIAQGAQYVNFKGMFFASHQVTMVSPIDKRSERDLLMKHNLEKAPRLEDFLSDKKQLK